MAVGGLALSDCLIYLQDTVAGHLPSSLCCYRHHMAVCSVYLLFRKLFRSWKSRLDHTNEHFEDMYNGMSVRYITFLVANALYRSNTYCSKQTKLTAAIHSGVSENVEKHSQQTARNPSSHGASKCPSVQLGARNHLLYREIVSSVRQLQHLHNTIRWSRAKGNGLFCGADIPSMIVDMRLLSAQLRAALLYSLADIYVCFLHSSFQWYKYCLPGRCSYSPIAQICHGWFQLLQV